MIERWQVYQLTVPTVPVGGLRDVPLKLDSDAPFFARLVKSRNIGLNGWNFRNPDTSYQASGLRTDWTVVQNGQQFPPFPTRGSVLYPEILFPVSASILCDIGNSTGQPITNARLVFYGSKVFADGALNAVSYPAKMGSLPFIYPTDVLNVGIGSNASTPFVSRDNQLQNLWDADFVIRAGVCDARAPVQTDGGIVFPGTTFADVPGDDPVQPSFSELYVMIRDEARKGYMNEPVHVDDIFGRASPVPQGQNSSNAAASPNFPGLFVPEIYLERNHSIYLDFYRYDLAGTSSTLGFVPIDLRVRWQGAKVFNRS
jgi:hypothetical protein